MAIDPDRLESTFEAYSMIGATDDGGLHRLTLTESDRLVRDRLVADAEEIGLTVRVDEIGNVFARRDGRDPDAAPVLIGSHLDSQPFGGRYDGQLGVLAALETLRAFEDHDVETERPVELVNWTNEEGSRFEHAMLGSAVFVGETSLDDALDLTDADGARLGDELERIGYAGSEPPGFEIDSYLELHVEQGPKLDARGTSVGVVEGVFGVAWLEVTIEGDADHAGPTPMHMRRDALAAAADAISEIGDLPTRLSEDAVATVGRLDAEPNSINVIPGRATFTVDVRSYDQAVLDRAVEAARFEVDAACTRGNVEYEIEERWRVGPTAFAPRVRDAVSEAAEACGASHEHLVSGAGHDASYMTRTTDSGMVFVPCVDGVTHNEAEFTRWEDVVAGVEVFADATRRLADDTSTT